MIDKINKQINYIKKNSKFYKNILKDYNQINNLSELKVFPYTTKNDIAKYNEDFLCVPEYKIRDFITTSGTMGQPVSFFLTENDLKRLGVNESNSFKICGLFTGDKVLLTTTIDKCFMAGLAYYLGVQALGIGIIRTGPGNLKYQWDMIERFRPNILIAVPSFLLKMIKFAKENNIDFSNISLKKAICIGEPIRNSELELNTLGKAISKELDIKLHSTYASTEMMTAFTECSAGKGGHLQEDLLFVEILNENGIEVGNEEIGEVVITTLGVEGMPLLRYKTGDICKVYRLKCSCGRSSLRLGPVLGRKGQRLKIKGTTIFPSAIIDAIYAFNQIEEFVIEVSLNEFNSDELCLFVNDDFLKISSLKILKDFLKSKLLFTPEIKFVKASVIKMKISNSNNRKLIRFIDNR
jgi:phenylacetate-CoA ligase